MRFAFHIDAATANQVREALRGMPNRIEMNVFRAAGRKAAKTINDAIKSLTPVQKKQTKQSKAPHLRDTVKVRQRTYRKSKTASVTYFAVGFGSPQKPNAHLVEDGTAQRFTGSKTRYREESKLRIKTKKGWAFKRRRKSLGSFAVDGAARVNRGIMPAFRPAHKAFSGSGEQARQAMLSEIKNRLQTELSKNAKTMRATFGGLG